MYTVAEGTEENFENCKVINYYGDNYLGYTNHCREASRAILCKDGNIMLSHETKIGQWMIPGGGREENETPAECCIREVAEETGLITTPAKCFLIMNEYYEDWKFVSYYFACVATGITERKPTEREIQVGAVPEWITINEAIDIFSHHQDYAESDEERRGIYLREYTALKEFINQGGSMNSDSNMWGKKVIEKALEYANYKWTASEKNMMHGIDENGCFVDTPDITWQGETLACGWWKVGEVNVGIPYGWGNASTLEEFAIGIKEGKYAGNVPEDKKRYGSNNTVGVDCSGLLTVCWELPKKIATRDIPEYATVLECIDEIQQGDVFAKIGSHVMFFKEFVDARKKEVIIIDATRSTGKVSQRIENVAELFAKGYEIYRRK